MFMFLKWFIMYRNTRCEIKKYDYLYMALANDTEIVHSQIIDEDGIKKVICV